MSNTSGEYDDEVDPDSVVVVTYCAEDGCCCGIYEFGWHVFDKDYEDYEDGINACISQNGYDDFHWARSFSYEELLDLLGDNDTVEIDNSYLD